MVKVKRRDKQAVLKKCKTLMSRARTRKRFYKNLSEKNGCSLCALRKRISRARLTSKKFSLMCTFSKEEEDALVDVCILCSRDNRPLTIPDFIRLASFFASRFDEAHFFTRSFSRRFLKRHKEVLCKRTGKVTSPTRCSGRMLQKTEEFIEELDPFMASHHMNQKNIVVFDETIIGDDVSLPVFMGERRKSGGGNLNVNEPRQVALGCYIPFSMPNGSTPFRVFIFRTGKLKKGQEIIDVLIPKDEFGLRKHPNRLYLASETGYLNITLFRRVIEEFTKWWRTTNHNLDCHLISDNLPIHRNKSIVEYAESNGIHMHNIMPGSSHWFQVHDQKPFGSLKKKMWEKKFNFLSLISLTRRERRDLLTCIFYQAEAEALECEVIRKTFAEVGLFPWNPKIIRALCQEHTSAPREVHQGPLQKKLLGILDRIRQEKEHRFHQMMSNVESVSVEIVQEEKEKCSPEEESENSFEYEEQEGDASEDASSMSIGVEPPAKRQRVISCSRKSCCIKGCENTHFWSKKWKSCPKCKKNFCPSHLHCMHNHTC